MKENLRNKIAFQMARTQRIYEIASTALGKNRAEEWMRTPHMSIGFKTPEDYLTCPENATDVEELIHAEEAACA